MCIALGVVALYWTAEGITFFGLLNDMEALVSDEWIDTLIGLESAYPVLFLTTAVLFVVWSYGAHSNLAHLGRRQLRYEDHATIWWWIVPFANFVMPFRVVYETARGSLAAPGDPHWQASRIPPAAIWWTALFIAGVVFTNVGAAMITAAQGFSEFEAGSAVSLVGCLAMIGAAIASVLMIKGIVLGQEGVAAALGVSPGSTARDAAVSIGATEASGWDPSCFNCGSVLVAGAKYCSTCGQAV